MFKVQPCKRVVTPDAQWAQIGGQLLDSAKLNFEDRLFRVCQRVDTSKKCANLYVINGVIVNLFDAAAESGWKD